MEIPSPVSLSNSQLDFECIDRHHDASRRMDFSNFERDVLFRLGSIFYTICRWYSLLPTSTKNLTTF
jgi:hypothetical protein